MIDLPTPRQLRYLCALADHLHFGRAAAACAVTQSTLSAGIQELEATLGATLVERTKRRVMLTPLGHELVGRARRLLRESEDMVALARSRGEPLSGALRLGVIPTIGPYLLPAVLPLLRARHPKLRLYLREEQTADLIAGLDEGRLDLIVLALPYETGDLAMMKIGKDDLFLVCPAGHPLATAPVIAPANLSEAEMLLLEDGHCLRRHALEACELTGPGRHEVFQGTSLKTLVAMVAGGLGVTLLPAMALQSEISEGSGLVARPLAAPAAREIALAWRKSSPREAEFRRFGDLLREADKSMPHKDGEGVR
ncbi:MAG TPA: LysR substrate-binding domain-containing protein [Stellaceae bacterium]|nr:LysR substrate-binding domain-containing protein [Stellaceae bacterium]